MCVNSCGCAIITREGQQRAVGLILDGLYSQLTEARTKEISPGSVFLYFYNLETVAMVMGGCTPRDVLSTVQEVAKDHSLIPKDMKLELAEERQTDRTYRSIVFVQD